MNPSRAKQRLSANAFAALGAVVDSDSAQVRRAVEHMYGAACSARDISGILETLAMLFGDHPDENVRALYALVVEGI